MKKVYEFDELEPQTIILKILRLGKNHYTVITDSIFSRPLERRFGENTKIKTLQEIIIPSYLFSRFNDYSFFYEKFKSVKELKKELYRRFLLIETKTANMVRNNLSMEIAINKINEKLK